MHLLNRLAAVALVVGFVETAQAALVYSNTTSFTGSVVPVGAGGTATQGAVTLTSMFSDDIQVVAGAGGQSVTSITFHVGNLNTGPVTVRPRVRFFADDNSGIPGTLITAATFDPVTIGGLTATSLFGILGTGSLVIPANGRLWAGLLFDNANGAGGTTSTTAAEMENVGVAVFTGFPAGSSTTGYFLSPAPASGSYIASNPAGGPATASGSLGWGFEVVVPEPGSAAAVGVAVAGLLAKRVRRR